jgi:hypothetical protein
MRDIPHPADSDMTPTVGPAPSTDTGMTATVGLSPRADTDTSATDAPPAGDDSDMSPTPMLSKSAAARYLGVSEKTIERHIAPGRYAGRTPQYAVSSLDAWRRERGAARTSPATSRPSPTVAVALHQGYEAALEPVMHFQVWPVLSLPPTARMDVGKEGSERRWKRQHADRTRAMSPMTSGPSWPRT